MLARPPSLFRSRVLSPVIDDADQEEHADRRDPVGQHHVHGPVDPIGVITRVKLGAVGGENAHDRHSQCHIAHVTDRTVSDQLLEIGLGHRHQGAVKDAENTENRDPYRPVIGTRRSQRPGQPDQAVAADLEQDARQDHADRRRGLDMRVGKPGVERERRQLDDESR